MFLLINNEALFADSLIDYAHMLGQKPVLMQADDPKLPAMLQDAELSHVCLVSGPSGLARPEPLLRLLALLETHRPGVPVLGIGLGAALLCLYSGGQVLAAPPTHGRASQVSHQGAAVLAGVESPFAAGRYDAVRLMPQAAEDLEILASEGKIPLVIAHRRLPWTGMLFHPESVLTPCGLQLVSNFVSMGHKAHTGQRAPRPVLTSAHTGPALPLPEILDALGNRQDLSQEMARQIFERLMQGQLSSAQAGALLLALRAKGESAVEIAMAARAVLACAQTPTVPDAPCLDVVGTGGDGKNSFNCSTGTALIMAALGYKVVKHGNRSVSSKCGSADVLERLGMPLHVHPDNVAASLALRNFVFLFAPYYHPSFSHIMPVRKELGVRTLFNFLGPLVNPAMPRFRLIGVSRPAWLPLMAGALAELGGSRSAVVHGAGGYDELTPLGPADILFVDGAQQQRCQVDPRDFGFAPCTEEALCISGPEQGESILRLLLAGQGPKAMLDMLAMNVGMALHLVEGEPLGGTGLADSMQKAVQAVSSGIGREVLYA